MLKEGFSVVVATVVASCTEPRICWHPTKFRQGSAFWMDGSFVPQVHFLEKKNELVWVKQALHHKLQMTGNVN